MLCNAYLDSANPTKSSANSLFLLSIHYLSSSLVFVLSEQLKKVPGSKHPVNNESFLVLRETNEQLS